MLTDLQEQIICDLQAEIDSVLIECIANTLSYEINDWYKLNDDEQEALILKYLPKIKISYE